MLWLPVERVQSFSQDLCPQLGGVSGGWRQAIEAGANRVWCERSGLFQATACGELLGNPGAASDGGNAAVSLKGGARHPAMFDSKPQLDDVATDGVRSLCDDGCVRQLTGATGAMKVIEQFRRVCHLKAKRNNSGLKRKA